ncbi:MAG: hypothetical protein CM15mP107_1940 [Bacteroidota bacterium]|nr:MAG: hypothetical protein CM15mP107_1940 [Bacteroidota bacterium]
MSNQIISEKGVHLAGDFQDWDPSSLEMLDTDSDSIYQITISLVIDSVYEYKFINGDSWGEDETIDEECGNGNRILILAMSRPILKLFVSHHVILVIMFQKLLRLLFKLI